jgi:nitroreductase
MPDFTEPSNPTLASIHQRHSVRMFQDQAVPEESLLAMLRSANTAPSAHNQQSWRFVVIRDEKKRELVNLVIEKSAEFPHSASILLRMAARSIGSAPVIIAVTNTGETIEHGLKLFNLESSQAFDFLRTMEIQSSAAAVENLLLAATSLGLGAVWLGILYLIKDTVLQFLGEPKGEFMAVIPVGFPSRPAKSPQKKPMDLILRELV